MGRDAAMWVACLLILHLPVRVERQRDPALANAPLIVGGRRWDEGAVLDCCPQAVTAGVEPGMRLSQAEALCPRAHFLPADEEAYEAVHRALVSSARRFTPTVETDELGLVYADVSGLKRRFDDDAGAAQWIEEIVANQIIDEEVAANEIVADEIAVRGLLTTHVQIGVGSSKFVARQAAQAARPGEACTVSPGEEKAFLSPLDISVLPLDPEMERRLRLLGVRTLGALTKLPRLAVLRQFGSPAGALYDMACGKDARPVHAEAPPLRLTRSHSFLDPVSHRGPLLAHVGHMAHDLATEIDCRGYQAEGLLLEIEEAKGGEGTVSHTIGKPVTPPSSSADHLSRLGARMLGSLTVGGPVTALSLTVYPLRPFHWGAAQLTLFDSGDRARSPSFLSPFRGDEERGLMPSSLALHVTFGRALRETLRRLRDRFGELSILVASLVVAPAPCPIQVTTDGNGLPRAIVWRERIWEVRSIYEHWRERRRWWGHPIAHDYFRLEIESEATLSSTRMKAIFRDVRNDRWYLERRHI